MLRTRAPAAVLIAAVLVGCGAGTATVPADAEVDAETAAPEGPVPRAAPDASLPPGDTAGLAADPHLAALYAATGTLLTRGALIERRVRTRASDGSGYGSSGGTVVSEPHLALYLAFSDEDLDDVGRYLDAVVPLTLAFAGEAFARWSDLASFDICLVAASDSDAAPEPAIALVDVTRAGYARWVADGADLVGLRFFTKDPASGVRLELSEPLRALVAARDAAGPA